MSVKRSRAAFEADLQAQQSPYVAFGTPLPPLDPKVRDDGSYVPVWKQEVVDERGRKRLHGAFTGGHSAGYFNTVGSKEGWTPSTFVSSRSNRHNAASQQKPEDFMDEEDLREAEEAQKVQTEAQFSGLGSTADERPATVMDLLRPQGASVGVRLLQKMGWREGQGIGPRVRRAVRGDANEADDETHLFAPDDVSVLPVVRKTDAKGLGFEGEAKLTPGKEKDSDNEDEGMFNRLLPAKEKPAIGTTKNAVKGGIGIGILNGGSDDDEDPYAIGPRLSYNRILGGDKKKKKREKEKASGTANPLLKHKPVFVSKRGASKNATRTCHDGRPPLAGFILAIRSGPDAPKYPPPEIPPDWQPPSSTEAGEQPPAANGEASATSEYPSTAEVAKASTHDPSSRGQLLGESKLPGKSVFAYLTPNARDRLATLTHKTTLPAAGSETASSPHPTGNDPAPSNGTSATGLSAIELAALIPPLEPDLARQALGRGVAGFVPYADDPAKLARYRSFLSYRAGLAPDTLVPPSEPPTSLNDWTAELAEFAHAAQLFRPMRGLMASRFTAATSSSAADTSPHDDDATPAPSADIKDQAREAARLGQFGPLTRTQTPFYPTRLLCKRFAVPAPPHAAADGERAAAQASTHAAAMAGAAAQAAEGAPPSSSPTPAQGPGTPGYGSKFASAGYQIPTHAAPQKDKALLGETRMAAVLRDAGYAEMAEGAGPRPGLDAGREKGAAEQRAGMENGAAAPTVEGHGRETKKTGGGGLTEPKGTVDPERNEALEQDRAGEALFRAVFGSDSEDE